MHAVATVAKKLVCAQRLIFTGGIDSSGIEFFYTSTPRQHDAGILSLGHRVNRFMIIPPNAGSYSIMGKCSAECTSQVWKSTILLSNELISVRQFNQLIYTWVCRHESRPLVGKCPIPYSMGIWLAISVWLFCGK